MKLVTKFKIYFLVCPLILLSNNINGQNRFEQFLKLLPEGESYFMKADDLIDLSLKENDLSNAIKITHKLSLDGFKMKNYNIAIKYGLKEVSLFENNDLLTKEYSKALYNLGRFYFDIEDYNESILYHNRVLIINNNQYKVGQSLGELGRNFDKEQDFFKAENYFLKGINVLKKLNQTRKTQKSLFFHLVNLSIVYVNIGDGESLNKSISSLKKAEIINKKYRLGYNTKVILNNAFANTYNNEIIFNFKKAKSYYKQNLKLSRKVNDTLTLASTYNNISELYLHTKNDSSFFYAKKGLSFVKRESTKARLYENIAKYYSSLKKYENALMSINFAIKSYVNKDVNSKLEKIDVINVVDKSHLLECLERKASILMSRYELEKNNSVLFKIKKIILNADIIIQVIEESNTEEKTKLYWRKKVSAIYKIAALTSYYLKDNKSMFYYMEKNKALLLTEDVIKNSKLTYLPKEIKTKTKKLKKQIYQLEYLNSKEVNSTLLRDSLFNAKVVFDKYQDSIKQKFPDYFNKKETVKITSLNEVKKNLFKNEILLSYSFSKNENKSSLLCLVVSKDSTFSYEVKRKGLEQMVKAFKENLRKPLSTKEQFANYNYIGSLLFNNLFPTQKIKDNIKDKELIVIPDGILLNLPFEALIVSKKENDFLLYQNNVNYLYSYSFLNQNKNLKRKTKSPFIGYSPVNFEDKELQSLKETENELESIYNLIGGEIKIYEKANKKDFLLNSSNSKIIHLATHANASLNPWIAFSDDKLNLHELYTYKNNADLVTLSACESAIGEIAEGEGVLSLARGFFYSGAKSVVSSLWSVNDKSTSFLMQEFYKNLKEGQTKSVALTQAKRKYLKTHSLSEKSPYYWASFVLIGDDEAIQFNSFNYLYLVFLFTLFLLAFFIHIKNKKRG